MDSRYPVGKFEKKDVVTDQDRTAWIQDIADLPARVRAATEALPDGGLDRPYREGGWTGRQVVHHLADSHMNSFVRFRLALTEDEPTVKPYDEAKWAELVDSRSAPVELSLSLLENLHDRWVMMLASMAPEQWSRVLVHPEIGRIDLDYMLQMYAWHSRHHVAHIGLIK